jgi:hypothetical protein
MVQNLSLQINFSYIKEHDVFWWLSGTNDPCIRIYNNSFDEQLENLISVCT